MDRRKEIIAMWEAQPETFPVFLEEALDIFSKVDTEQKQENEALVQEFSGRIRKKMPQSPLEEQKRQLWSRELEEEFHWFAGKERILCLTDWMS